MRLLGILPALCLVALLAGCGATQHDVQTGENGSLEGMWVTPEPQSLNISSDEVFSLDWADGFRPPGQFTVKLESVDSTGLMIGVLTALDSNSVGHYRINPSFYLTAGTFYLLTVTTDSEQVRSMYLTDSFSSRAHTRTLPLGGGELVHVVKRK